MWTGTLLMRLSTLKNEGEYHWQSYENGNAGFRYATDDIPMAFYTVKPLAHNKDYVAVITLVSRRLSEYSTSEYLYAEEVRIDYLPMSDLT